jgi:hypothetical protein
MPMFFFQFEVRPKETHPMIWKNVQASLRLQAESLRYSRQECLRYEHAEA